MEGPSRKQNRLQNWDYSSPAAYFVTMCTQNRALLLSEILVGAGLPGPRLTKYGWITDDVIQRISEKYPMVQREKYVIMPNHIHFIFRIEWELCGPGDCRESIHDAPTISTVMAWFKYQATKEINALDGISGRRVFQRSFHDHIIRNRAEYEKIWQYIDQNPLTWEQDCFYPDETT